MVLVIIGFFGVVFYCFLLFKLFRLFEVSVCYGVSYFYIKFYNNFRRWVYYYFCFIREEIEVQKG